MINYPGSIKKTNTVKINNYGNRGMTLESDLNDTNNYYLEKNIAVIYKKPTPIQVVETNYEKITKAYFKQPSTTDYNGIYKGYYIDFEAKETTSKTSFPLSNIHNHQIIHLKKIIEHGGIGFLIVRFTRLDKTYLLFAEDLLDFLDKTKKKSIPLSFFEEKGFEIEFKLNPRIDYLSIVKKEKNLWMIKKRKKPN